MYKAVIFDLDGTLLDTLDDLTSAVNFALSRYGLPFRTSEEIRSFIGNGVKKLLERASENKVETDSLLPLFKGYYKEHCADKTQPYRGIMQLLTRLKEKGLKSAVVSNKAHFATEALVKKYFKALIPLAQGEDEEHGVMRKPNPASLLTVMGKLGVKKEQTVYVGDSDVDIQTAKNAGMDCISVTWGFKDEQFLIANGANKIARTAEDILRFCGVEI